MRHLILRGNWYNRILSGPRGVVDQLIPLDPDCVKPKQLDTGRIIYVVKNAKTLQTDTFTQDDIFHVRGVSDDGIEGKSVLAWARDSIGLAAAQSSYAARLFSQGALHGGTITVPGVLNAEASARMATSFVTTQGTWHMPKVLEQGATYAESQLTPEDSQMLLSQQFSVTEMARWLGLQPHKIMDLTRSTNNNIEHQGLEYVTDSLSPWLILIEQAILRDLIVASDRFFAEFNVDALMRGDSAARGAFYTSLHGIGAINSNEIRSRENLNSYPDGETYYVAGNMRPTDEPYAPEPAPTPGTPGKPASSKPKALASDDRARAVITASADRVLRKEYAAVSAAAVKHASDQAAFDAEVTAFYAKHATLVAQTMVLAEPIARFYADSQRDEVLHDGLAVMEDWTPEYLVGLAIDAPQRPPDPQPITVNVDAPTTIQKGAFNVETPVTFQKGAMTVDAPTTVQRGAFNVESPVTIQKGAIAVDAPVHIETPVHVQAHPKRVVKTVTRDPQQSITGSTEEYS
jgi:HK97 family phage portal protein